MKIEAGNTEQGSRLYGRHFDHTDALVSKISRESINALKAHFADQMSKDDWRLVRFAVQRGECPGGWVCEWRHCVCGLTLCSALVVCCCAGGEAEEGVWCQLMFAVSSYESMT